MNKEAMQQLRQLPIEAVAERLGLRVACHKSLCPFHDDHHASLTFSARTNAYRCFACGAHGGTIDLVMNRLRMPFPDACRWLAGTTNIIVEECKPQTPYGATPPKPFDASRYARHFEHPWLSAEAQRFLFGERKLDRRVVAWCRLTSWTDRQGTHWLQTPYFDAGWQLVGVQYRNLDCRKPAGANASCTSSETRSCAKADGRLTPEKPRFRFPYGSRCSIYNMPVIAMLRPEEPLYITEGCSDCWAMLSAGHKAVAIPSATLLSQADKDMLLSLSDRLGTAFRMYPDSDAPGERLFLQLKETLPSLEHHQLPPGCKDFSDYYVSAIKAKTT